MSVTTSIQASKARAFLKSYAMILLFVAISGVLFPWLRNGSLDYLHTVTLLAIPPVIMAAIVAVAFTPREISWNDQTITIAAFYPGSGEFDWTRLKAWGPFSALLLVRFEGFQTFQIASSGFKKEDWKAFRSVFRERFENKKTLLWIADRPLLIRKKDEKH